jgi:hypothetical protein
MVNGELFCSLSHFHLHPKNSNPNNFIALNIQYMFIAHAYTISIGRRHGFFQGAQTYNVKHMNSLYNLFEILKNYYVIKFA